MTSSGAVDVGINKIGRLTPGKPSCEIEQSHNLKSESQDFFHDEEATRTVRRGKRTSCYKHASCSVNLTSAIEVVLIQHVRIRGFLSHYEGGVSDSPTHAVTTLIDPSTRKLERQVGATLLRLAMQDGPGARRNHGWVE